MISILIPCYNYNIFPLVSELFNQCESAGIEYEIIVINDGGTDFKNENIKINSFENTTYINNGQNIGRTEARNFLANKATYNWLLFLDADVFPTSSNFIKTYYETITNYHQVIVGGCKYKTESKTDSTILRYKYGIEREQIDAIQRNKNPYTYILSGNLLIKKEIFIENNFSEQTKYYGMDIFFAYKLMSNKISVLHIENRIYHLGLEQNAFFFDKCLLSVKSRQETLLDKPGIEKINSLINYYKKIDKLKMKSIISLFFKLVKPILKRLILSKNPSLFCLDIYRLGYMCTLK